MTTQQEKIGRYIANLTPDEAQKLVIAKQKADKEARENSSPEQLMEWIKRDLVYIEGAAEALGAKGIITRMVSIRRNLKIYLAKQSSEAES